MMMKAMVCTGKDEPLQLQQVETPALLNNEVLVQVKAAAFNRRDWWIQKGLYANLRYPIILGSDASGIVVKTGTDVAADWLQKEVIINPAMNWGDNPAYQNRDTFKILGLPDNGSFAEYVKIPADCLHIKPAYLSFDEAAALPLAALTGYRALFTKAQLKAGDNVLITGIGSGVALMVLQMAVAAGANVYVTSGSDEKIEKAVQLGAKLGVNYKINGWHKLFQSAVNGFDVMIDSAAGDNFKTFVDLANMGARIVLFGGTQGAITMLNPQKIFWKQLSIIGTSMGTPEEFSAMLGMFDNYKIQPVIDKTFELGEAELALRRMDEAEQFGKIILRVNA